MMASLRGWVDYDRPMLPALNPDQRIEYFEGRVRRVVINPLRRILKTEIIVAGEDSSAVLIIGVSLCCAVEATGKFLTGGKGGQDALAAPVGGATQAVAPAIVGWEVRGPVPGLARIAPVVQGRTALGTSLDAELLGEVPVEGHQEEEEPRITEQGLPQWKSPCVWYTQGDNPLRGLPVKFREGVAFSCLTKRDPKSGGTHQGRSRC
jgi:hypothetical protein